MAVATPSSLLLLSLLLMLVVRRFLPPLLLLPLSLPLPLFLVAILRFRVWMPSFFIDIGRDT